MANYIIVNGELYHHGIKGMKWGVRRYQNKDGSLTAAGKRKQARLDKKATKLYTRAGIRYGQAEYERSRGRDTYKEYNTRAKAFDKTANKLDAEGRHLKAESARTIASIIRARGRELEAERKSRANWYENDGNKLKQKVANFATKHKVDLGKKKINSIINSGKVKGWDENRIAEKNARDEKIHDFIDKSRDNIKSALDFIKDLRETD